MRFRVIYDVLLLVQGLYIKKGQGQVRVKGKVEIYVEPKISSHSKGYGFMDVV